MDEFSEQAWGYEFDLQPVSPGESFVADRKSSKRPFELLLVESAWNGNGGKWRYQLTGENAPSPELRKLVDWCKSSGIPTVFWNKEDPAHFDDFIKTAELFDFVFTTDANLVPRYKDLVPSARVGVLPFAAQPVLHNPILKAGEERRGDIAFAGTYFAHKFESRQEQIALVLGAALRASQSLKEGLVIFSRFAGKEAKYQFPSEYERYVEGALPYNKMLSAFKRFKVVLNVNTITQSPTMCSRRVFEASASGAVVVSTDSVALRGMFSEDEIPIIRDAESGSYLLRRIVNSPEVRDRISHRAQRKIWENHTYTDRAFALLSAIGLVEEQSVVRPKVSILASTNRPQQLSHLFSQIARQRSIDVELLLMLHGIDEQPETVRAQYPQGISGRVFKAPKSWSLGKCMNHLASNATGEYMAKFDDDDLYFENYLRDQINALEYSGADIVGKQASYMYHEQSDSFLLRNPEHELCFTDFVAGPTLVWHRRVTEGLSFPDRTKGEDTGFLNSAVKRGYTIYSADRFNFVQMRSSSVIHTWEVDDEVIFANSRVIAIGSGVLNVEC
ncbi:hypothetical protein AK829_00860 [Corynebacterium riegelii]|uniref:Glycosyltransferase n=1 Tax=Corynebacterium riegelii TaxID=156976 RepID=A0A0K1REZ5_9CORY|nr:hypothetical protein AK829_00860 [Corynebacterium riegelii]